VGNPAGEPGLADGCSGAEPYPRAKKRAIVVQLAGRLKLGVDAHWAQEYQVTVGKVSTDKSVQNFSRYWVVLSTSSTDAF